jgi:hypothetical protein
MSNIPSVIADKAMAYLTGTNYSVPITIQAGSKGQDSTGETVFTVSSTLSARAVLSRAAENEQRLNLGMGVFAQGILYCRYTDIVSVWGSALINYRVLYDGDTYEIVKVDDTPLGDSKAYVALYIRRV